MKIKTESKSSQTALKCARMRMLQSLLGAHSIALQGALERTAEDGSERRSRGLDRNLLCACALDRTGRSIAVIETSTYEAERELEKRD
jgi:hypothetical protein